MRFQQLTTSSNLGLSLASARLHLKIAANVTAEDELILDYINSASTYISDVTGLIIPSSTWVGWCDGFETIMKINRRPITGVTSIEYYKDDVLTTLSPSDYSVDTYGRVTRIYIEEIPIVDDGINKVKITFSAGYSSLNTLDARIKQAIRLLITECEQDRASYVVGHVVSELPNGFKMFMNNLRSDEF